MSEQNMQSCLTSAERLSNMELLRIVSMFLVLAVHANYAVFGPPTAAEAGSVPWQTFFRLWEESLSLVCVNVFVLISGYFGIRLTWKGIGSLLFCTGFYILAIHLFMWGAGMLSWQEWKWIDIVNGANNYWFVAAYLGLMLLSPVLNTFLSKTSDLELRNYLLLFYAMVWTLGWAVESPTLFQGGYSVLSFAGIYLLGAYIRRGSACWMRQSRKLYLSVYIGITGLAALCMWAILRFVPIAGIQGYSFNVLFLPYTSLQTLVGSVALLLLFSKLSFRSRWINRVALSVLSVYLVHTHDLVFPYMRQTLLSLRENNGTLLFIALSFGFLAAVFAVCVCVDRLRLVLWNLMIRR